MAAIVVDASVALAWALPDEISAYADSVLGAVEIQGMRVPELWPREVANGLAVAYLRKRLTTEAEQLFLSALARSGEEEGALCGYRRSRVAKQETPEP